MATPPELTQIRDSGHHPVLMGEHALAHLDQWLAGPGNGAPLFILCDETTATCACPS